MQVTYRPYKRASVFPVSSSHKLTQSTSTLDVQPEVEKVSAHLSLFMTRRIQHFSHIRLSSSIYFLPIVSLLLTDTIYGIRSVPTSLNILIHYERFYIGFYAPYFHIQLLGCNTKITDKLKLNVFMHI
jgi:hypothetical protein